MGLNLTTDDSAQKKMLGADTEAPFRSGETMDGSEKGKTATDDDWLKLHNSAFDQSADYYEVHLRREWKDSIAHFNSEHAPGSKYHKVEYAKRSRIFRPKTRSMVLRKEAAAAGAFFSMDDVCGISPVDPDNPRGQAAAAVMNALTNHRLEIDVPWFLIAQGNYQTAIVQGICCSKQYWDYEAEFEDVTTFEPQTDPTTGAPMMHPETGEPLGASKTEKRFKRAKVDKPCIQPVPPENIRFHPNANWLDPVATSPYLIYAFPMYVYDVKERAKLTDPKTKRPAFRVIDDAKLSQAAREYANSIEVRRDAKDRERASQSGGKLKDFDTVWVHEVFIKKDGVDYTFHTLGTLALLTDVQELEEVYFQNERPFVVGYASLKAFTPHPDSKVKQLAPIQRLANEIANQRIDNVRLAMNGRYWVRDGKKVDLASLQRSTPGSAVLMSDPQNDVKWDRPADVTASAYQEQDRVNADFDDLGGLFTASTVQSDNHLNETVGGMRLMSGDAGQVQEYELKIFAVTYMAPVLRQLIKLEQAYETDMAKIALAGKQAQAVSKYGVDPTTDDLMNEQLLVTVNVGVGATSPDKRVEKLKSAMETITGFIEGLLQTYGPQVVQSPGVQAFAAEVLGASGYKDAQRFLNFGAPQPKPGDQQQGQPQGGQAQAQPPNPQLAEQVLQTEVSEKQKDREKDLAVARIKDMGDTTRKAMDSHTKLILKGIEQMAQGRGPIEFPALTGANIARLPVQPAA